jgi:hypothetical protein
MAVQAAMGDVGERKTGESLEAFNTRRRSTVGNYLDEYFRRANKFRIAPEEMDAAAAKFVEQNTQEYNQGGRVGLYGGGSPDVMEETEMPPISDIIREEGIDVGPQVKKLDAGAQSITYEGNMDPNKQMASANDPTADANDMSLEMFGKPYKELTPPELDLFD